MRWVTLEGKVAWSPQWLQEGSHAKAELHKRDAQATAAFWGAFPFYNSMCAALKVPQERKNLQTLLNIPLLRHLCLKSNPS